MRVYPEQLARQLNPLTPCYLIFGDDPWLVETSKAQICAAAKQQGFEEKVQLTQETGFNWHELQQEWQAMSLFASRRIIELTLPQAKPGTEGSQTLQSLLQQPNPDMLLIIQGPKLASEQTNSKWFKSLDSQGVYVPCITPEGPQFQRWLDARIKHFGLRLQADARAMLFALYEGNLLAADQAMQLLQLLSPEQPIGADELGHYFEDQSRFSVFQLTDALLGNKQDKAQHMLAQLHGEGTAMPILLWSLFKELTLLLQLKSAQAQGTGLNSLWSKHRIWDKRKPLYQAALERLTLPQIEHMLATASKLELMLKQQGVEDWTALSHLCLLFDPKAHKHLAHIELY
ncbi:DNA polymerase III subunit delta [Shewanella salipaludis]|uniref:DNA polymerase III subunit delta n=1 Tax=Shewanella salipaludis TaxID=2723052 RepID=A0A972JN36_9GAMM|nr:DNA polymerase III subunit delta [Shewanella salipaludis]NMH67147.1 DNA polymerase III subunit delta [Shewanella salipaludis]